MTYEIYFSPFLPEALPFWVAALMVAAAFFTSALTATFGLGVGLALLAVMTAAMPAAAVTRCMALRKSAPTPRAFIFSATTRYGRSFCGFPLGVFSAL